MKEDIKVDKKVNYKVKSIKKDRLEGPWLMNKLKQIRWEFIQVTQDLIKSQDCTESKRFR